MKNLKVMKIIKGSLFFIPNNLLPIVVFIWIIFGCTSMVKGNQGLSKNTSVIVSKEGKIVSVKFGDKGIVLPLLAYTQLSGCDRVGSVIIKNFGDGSVQTVQRLIHRQSKKECTLTESFRPDKENIRWEVEIDGSGDPWTIPIETHLDWPDTTNAKFWIPYGGERDKELPNHFSPNNHISKKLIWSDPLKILPFQNLEIPYGGREMGVGFSIPLVAIINEQKNIGITLALSPEDTPSTMIFRSDSIGHFFFSRKNLRISSANKVKLSMDIVVHEGDWRPALGWMVKNYSDFFDPPNPEASLIAGCGAFCSSSTVELDATKLNAMGFRVNWAYGFTFPYIGMYLPLVKDDKGWMSYEGKKESPRGLENMAIKWRNAGIYSLAEFVTTEWGFNSLDGQNIPYVDSRAIDEPTCFWEDDTWKDATEFLLKKLPGSVLFDWNGKPVFSGLGSPFNNVVVDPGEPVFAKFLVDQATRFIYEVPTCSGICIDRMDHLERYNPRRDDGVSWYNGKPARSLRMSWLQIMDTLGPLFHNAGKSVFVNPHIKRIDLMKQVDGIFDEFGYLPFNNNSTAFLGLRKPVMAWTPDEDYLREDVDAFFQRYLYLGIFPMAPFPENATVVRWLNAITPSEWAEKQYLDYGPLLDLIRGKKWVLEPKVVQVKNDLAKVNMFEIPEGFIIPVVFGGTAQQVTVLLRKFSLFPENVEFEVIHPGSLEWKSIKSSPTSAGVQIDVPLVRGCAMLRVKIKERFQ